MSNNEGTKKRNINPQLNYRIPKKIQDEYRRVCEENTIDPGKRIQKFMTDFIKEHTKEDIKNAQD